MVVVNNIIYDNHAFAHAGGISISYGHPSITNCSIYGNVADALGGGVRNDHGYPFIINTLITDNWATYGTHGIYDASGITTVRCSCVQDQSCPSTLIDAGCNSYLPADQMDLDGDGDTAELILYDYNGQDRIQGSRVDIGAAEEG